MARTDDDGDMHRQIPGARRHSHKPELVPASKVETGCYKRALSGLVFSARVQAPHRSTFQPIEAGAVLAGTVVACGGAGALIGWAAGSPAEGALGGVVVGLPAGVFTVYRRFRGFFT
jgi:hypothetical protein